MKYFLIALTCGVSLVGCTKQGANSFRLLQVQQQFPAINQGSAQVDVLWVVDNSASMDVSQSKLRSGFASFAAKYMKPTWDIRAAAITTDTYFANPAFQNYINATKGGTTGWTSPYIQSRLSTFRNPAFNLNLVNLQTGSFPSGIRMKDQVPAYGLNYAHLLPGIHDGPIAALCSENHPYFFLAATQCRIRDDQTKYSGTSHCLNPAAGESSVTQCVNTVENDTVHSGVPIISTIPPSGVAADANWTAALSANFMVNLTTGSAGSGSERGMQSVLQLLSDNETSPTAFFRKNSQRLIVFVSDEDDQTQILPTPLPAGFSDWTGYHGGCAPKTVDGYTYTINWCPPDNLLVPVATVKTQLDAFFNQLDGTPGAPANYAIVSIVAETGAAIQALQALRAADDALVGNGGNVSVDRADRYIALGNLVGNGSIVANIADDDYTSLLDQIGKTIAIAANTFTLARAPTSTEDMIVSVQHIDGTTTVVPPADYSLSGKVLTITNTDFILSLAPTDQILINYQPKTVY